MNLEQLNLVFSKDLLEQVLEQAKTEGTTVKEIVEKALRSRLRRKPRKPHPGSGGSSGPTHLPIIDLAPFDFSQELLEQLQAQAEAEGINEGEILQAALQEYLSPVSS